MKILSKKELRDGEFILRYPYLYRDGTYRVSPPSVGRDGRYKVNEVRLDSLEKVRACVEDGWRLRMAKESSTSASLIANDKIWIDYENDPHAFKYEVEIDIEDHSEGKLLYIRHLKRERNKKLVAKKKKQVLKATGTLKCEICTLTMMELYGAIGKNYIECHHRVPLSQYDAEGGKTRLNDLALVCPNCHSMLHHGKGQPQPTIEILKSAFRLAKSLR